jgi:hypothetical protein
MPQSPKIGSVFALNPLACEPAFKVVSTDAGTKGSDAGTYVLVIIGSESVESIEINMGGENAKNQTTSSFSGLSR